jgi:hypothetical protein
MWSLKGANRGKRLKIWTAVMPLLAWQALVPCAGAQTVSLPSNFMLTCDILGCAFDVTPGTLLPFIGSGFSTADTSVTLSGLPSISDSTLTCAASNGSFSCNYVMPDLPSVDIFLGTDAGFYHTSPLTVTGQPAGDTATIILRTDPGFGVYPVSGPPGSTIRLYGSGYVATVLGILGDTTIVITFGQNNPSGYTGTGPTFVDSNYPAQTLCVPTDGSLSAWGPCTITVPGYLPGTYKIGILAAYEYSIPDTTVSGKDWNVVTFTITPPVLTAVVPAEAKPGLTISVAGTGFSWSDRFAAVSIDGVSVTPSSGCPFSAANSGTITCSVVVPDTATAPGPHSITVTGIQYGDYVYGQFVVPGPFPLTLSSQQAMPGASLTVSGIAYNPADTSVAILVGGTNATPASGCPVTFGAFSCNVAIPLTLGAGAYNVQATGNVANDYDLAALTIVSALALNPPSGPVGANVYIGGTGFGSNDSKVSATFNGQPVALTFQVPGGVVNGQTIPPQTITGTSCPANLGVFPYEGNCYFTVPTAASTGTNTVTVTDDIGHSASATFGLTLSAALSPTQGSKGTVVSVTGYGFPQVRNVGFTFGSGSLNDPPSCNPSQNGALSCTFTVPDVAPGTYTLGINASNQTLSTMPFTVVPYVSPESVSVFPGSMVTLQGNGFSPSDTGLAVLLNEATISTPNCTLVRSTPSANFICTFSGLGLNPGPYVLKAVGNVAGDVAIGGYIVSGISIAPAFGPANTSVEATGYGFNPSDTTISFSLDGVPAPNPFDEVNFRSGCNVTLGAFKCRVSTPPTLGGAQGLVARGDTGDAGSASFQVAPFAAILKAQGPPGTQIPIEGNGFLTGDTSVNVSFNGQNLGACAITASSFGCSFAAPSVVPGTYAVLVSGSSGTFGDAIDLSFTVTPGISLSTAQGPVGQSVNLTGSGFAAADTSATVLFEFGANDGVQVASGCTVANGSLSSCSFIVPGTIPSGPVIPSSSYSILVTGSSGDQGVAAFTVTAANLVVSPSSAPIGATVTVSGGVFSTSDTTATLVLSQSPYGQIAIGPPSACAVVGGALSTCSFVVPSQLSGGAVLDSSGTGPYTITATGNTGDQVTASFSAINLLTVTPATITQGQSLEVSGAGFSCSPGPVCSTITFSASSPSAVVNPSSCPVNTTSGKFACSIQITIAGTNNPPPPGSYMLSAIGVGGGKFVNAPFTVIAPNTSLALASTAPPILGQFKTLTATISPAAASGSVAFYDGTALLGSAPLTGGQATLEMPALAFGAHSLKAVYTGSAGYSPASATLSQSIAAVSSNSLGAGTAFTADFETFFVATGDFNGDGVMDLAVANGAGGKGISVLLGNGDGTFRAAVNYDSGGTFPRSIAVADINGDGVADLAVANADGQNVTVLLGNGDGTFALWTQAASGNAPYSITAGDFNGDGIADLAFTNYNSGTVSVLIGAGGGAFNAVANYPVAAQPAFVATTDLNGDGIADLVTGSVVNSNGISVLIGSGDGTFQPAVSYDAGPSPSSIGVGDFNGDGKPDLAVLNVKTTSGNPLTNNVQVLLNEGNGTFLPAVRYTADDPVSVAVGDIDGDGNADLAVANSNGKVSVLLGKGDGTFGTAADFPAGVSLTNIAVADFNGDGRTDVAVTDLDTASVTILLGQKASTTAVMSTASPLTITYGQSVTLSLAITGTGFDSTAPTGAATLLDSGQTIAASGGLGTTPFTLVAPALGGGSHSLTGAYFGDSRYADSTSTDTIVIQVNEAAQTITFNPPASQTHGAAPFSLNATTSSGLPPAFISNSTTVCTVSGSTLTMTGVGICSITASQAGNANYLAAQPVTQTFMVNAATSAPIDVSSQVKVTTSGLVYSRATGTYSGIVTIQNIGSMPIAAPIQSVFTGLTTGATLTNGSGVVPSGSYAGAPYTTVAGTSPLAPGASVSISVTFKETGTAPISYVVRTLSGGF